MSASWRARGLGVLIVLALLAAALLVVVKRGQEPVTVLDRLDDEIGLFIWGDMPVKELASTGLAAEVEQGNPLRLLQIAFRLLHQHQRQGDADALAQARHVLDLMLDDYVPTERVDGGVVWHYPQDYDGIKAPWHSGMDQFLGPLTLWAAWEATGEARYRAAALASIRLALRSPPEGGALWRDGENCWISEYAWRGMKPEDEFYVLNGHLFGLLALAIFKEVAPAEDLERAYACARNGTLAYQQRFYRADGQWTWYQLAPRPVINPPHYALIELSLLRSLRLVTGDSGYRQAEDRRIEQFRAHYPVEYSEQRLLLARNGPPHPYMGDIYRPRVLCEHGDRSWTLYGRTPVLATAAERLPSRCTVSIDTRGYELPLYTTETVLKTSAAPERLTGPLAVELDARAAEGRSVSISPAFQARADEETYANDEGRIIIPVRRPIGPRDAIALVVHSEKAAGLGLLLEDSNGAVAHRSYADLPAAGDALVLANPLGFEGPELGRDIRSLTLRIHTRPTDDDFKLTVKEVLLIRSAAQLDALLQSGVGELPPE